MAHFTKPATDHYDKDSEFTYESTMNREVTAASVHNHDGDLEWKTDTHITCEAPKLVETYNTIETTTGMEISAYLLRRKLAPINFAMYGYSINASGLYANTSLVTINVGCPTFLLPSPHRIHFGKCQVKVGVIDKKSGATETETVKSQKATNGGLNVKSISGQETQL